MLKIVYRTGGTLNFKWRPVFMRRTGTQEQAEAKAQEIERMGYRTLILEASTPIPTTYEGGHTTNA